VYTEETIATLSRVHNITPAPPISLALQLPAADTWKQSHMLSRTISLSIFISSRKGGDLSLFVGKY
jgi:hypothetical protein